MVAASAQLLQHLLVAVCKGLIIVARSCRVLASCQQRFNGAASLFRSFVTCRESVRACGCKCEQVCAGVKRCASHKYVSSLMMAMASKHAKRRPVTTRERSMNLRGVRHGGFLTSFLDEFVFDSGPRIFSLSAPACKAAQHTTAHILQPL